MAHNAAMSACGQRWRLALTLFARLRRPTRLSVQAALMACAAARRWREALELLGDERDILCSNVATSACSERWQWAFYLFKRLDTPSAVTFHAVLRSFELCGCFVPELLLDLQADTLRSLRVLRALRNGAKCCRFWLTA